ncbi:small membrane protein-related [Anaeramoeba ignava]|uniref:Small membrane protein-related n=1 Tax=Anaeramoeba ignava TaxID=1746090 RepID=A0A9Q0LJU0_ANAIG|nr:small membrane protein-related [Anaeramoeba ignava]|eukprot:Anaeramoba_ignava/a353704_64.p1 GENE.a353704_64~~a353704_64.p1  ORF type:complete len:158 (-),score=31.80 a353704_64:211-654(-)
MAKISATIISLLSGVMFAAGWWMWIDAAAYASHIKDHQSVKFEFYLPGIFATISWIMVGITPISSEDGLEDEDRSKRIKIWLFASFTVGFGSIMGSVWVLAAVYAKTGSDKPDTVWPGVAGLFQTSLIFGCSLLYRWAKSINTSEMI